MNKKDESIHVPCSSIYANYNLEPIIVYFIKGIKEGYPPEQLGVLDSVYAASYGFIKFYVYVKSKVDSPPAFLADKLNLAIRKSTRLCHIKNASYFMLYRKRGHICKCNLGDYNIEDIVRAAGGAGGINVFGEKLFNEIFYYLKCVN